MRRLLATFFIILLLLPEAFCQSPPATIHKQVMDLWTLYNSIQEENAILKSHIWMQDSLAYSRMRIEIFEAFNSTPRINFDFLSTTDKIAVTGLFTKLLQANNPTSDILGFRFNETILKASEKYFKNELKSESEKARFGQVVVKLINNPVISTLVNSNPISAVTAAIISTVAGFSTTSADVIKEGNKVKDVEVKTMDAFSQKNIDAFKNELQPFTNFYDALNNASAKYLTGLEMIIQRYAYLKTTVDTYKHQLFASLSINDTNTLIKLSTLLPDPLNNDIDYNKYLKDANVRQCAIIAGKLPLLEQSVKEFRREYNQTLLIFLKEYILALQSARKLPSSNIDQTKINCLLSDIEYFIKNEISVAEN